MYFKIKTKVKYYDCDEAGRLKASAAMGYMQQSSGEHFDSLGIPNAILMENGMVFVLVKACMKVHRMPREAEQIEVGTVGTRTKGVKFAREFRIDSVDGERLISSYTTWVLIDPHTRGILRPAAFPHELPYEGSIIDNIIGDEKIPTGDGLEWKGGEQIKIGYSHIDVNGHVNNSHYADFICNAVEYDTLLSNGISKMVIHFQNEAMLGEYMKIKQAQLGEGRYLVQGAHSEVPCFQSYLELASCKG